ncbi:hypothetical protein D9M73_266820 [compost metagenome]
MRLSAVQLLTDLFRGPEAIDQSAQLVTQRRAELRTSKTSQQTTDGRSYTWENQGAERRARRGPGIRTGQHPGR